MEKKVIRHVINDTPSNRDFFHGGGHERTARSLAKAIVKFDKGDSAIGLEGSWGSGKSSVVEMAARKLEEKNDNGRRAYHFFTFDIWKSQGSGFRRSYLEHFITWAKKSFPKKRLTLEEIEKQVQGKTREIETNNHPVLDWYGVFVLIFLPFLPLYYFWAREVFNKLSAAEKSSDFFYSSPFLVLVFFIVLTLALSWWKYKFGPRSEQYSDFKSAISRMLLISSRQHQDHTVVQKVREVDPNDYEFHGTLREILRAIQSDKDRVVMVLDNIDRLPKKEIKEYWALVRSVFSRSDDSLELDESSEITAIVPYDRKLIETNVNENEEATDKESVSLSSLASRELFSKTFDEILIVSPPVLSNAREFFAEKLEQALPEQISADDRFRTYRIFCELLNIESGTTTPRQIVSFVNDISGLYELHDGRFKLPTVAAYIAHQDLLTESPSALSTKKSLNSKVTALAADDKLVQNLAAIVFNVQEDLAFQILLDEEIANAVVEKEPDRLIELESSPGFDLRVDDVIQANIDEWVSTGELGVAVKNIAEMFLTYRGDARNHVTSSLIKGFYRVDSISLDQDVYDSYLPLLTIADEKFLSSVLDHLINAVFLYIHQLEVQGFEEGQNTAYFLQSVSRTLADLSGKNYIVAALGKQTLPSAREYLFGLCSYIHSAGFGLDVFKDVSIDSVDEDQYFEQQFVEKPGLAILALSQFKSTKLLADDEWLSIAAACLEAIKVDGVKSEQVRDLLEIVVMAWQKVGKDKRNEIELDSTLIDGDFFRNIGAGENEPSKSAKANLLFLAQHKLGASLETPVKRQPNGQRVVDNSDAFETFNAVLTGESMLEDSQVELISKRAIESSVSSVWIEHGKANREHKAVAQVVTNMFSASEPPYLKLKYLFACFVYLQEIFESNVLKKIFSKYAQRISRSEVEKLKLEDFPEGVLQLTYVLGEGEWKALHEHADQLLKSIETSEWTKLITEMDRAVIILIEKLDSSGCELDAGNFRKLYVNVVTDVLSGKMEVEGNQGSFDTLLKAISKDYQEEIWRTLREKISEVTPASLQAAMYLFPQLVSDVACSGSRISKVEKDNVIRNLLSPALEGHNRQALKIFINMGYSKLKVYMGAAEKSSASMLQGAWKGFKDKESDKEMVREVSEALYGKKRSKSILDSTFWRQSRE